LKQALAAAQQFICHGQVRDVREYGRGRIHDTFVVTVSGGPSPQPAGPPGRYRFILQRLNRRVFPRPELIMGNLRLVTEHVRQRLQREPLGRRFELPRVLLTREGRDHFLDPQGSFWRALSFIEGAHSLELVRDAGHAREVGWALGLFHRLLSDLPIHLLADTLPGFHITPRYLKQYEAALAGDGWRESPEVAFCMRFVEERRGLVHVLEEAKARGRLALRPIHGDPKVNNVLLDVPTGQAVALVDLDTVKPGLVHYDIGDCLRSGANPLGEDMENWEEVRFDPHLARALLAGYLSQAGDILTDLDYVYLYDAIQLIPFELGLRYFTDYLQGNVYFKVAHPEHNLQRALVQFRLTQSIEAQAETIRQIIRDLRGRART